MIERGFSVEGDNLDLIITMTTTTMGKFGDTILSEGLMVTTLSQRRLSVVVTVEPWDLASPWFDSLLG